MRTSGGPGGRILIDPEALRRGSTKLKTVSGELYGLVGQLRAAPIPELAASVTDVPGDIQDAAASVSGFVAPVHDLAIELDRRALWTEIADALAAGYPLTGSQLNEFMAGMRDGTLIKYADGEAEARSAGRYLASLFRSNYVEPAKLRDLATILGANATYDDVHGAFYAGFIERFGAQNYVHAVRVIQAQEWPGGYQGGPYSDSFEDTNLMYRYFSSQTHLDAREAVNDLGSFALALAVATSSGKLAKTTEREIAEDGDQWAVAQLLYKGTFGATFLKEVFQHGVIDDIVRSSKTLGPQSPISRSPIGAQESFAVPTDQRLLILEALGRSPDGAALALTSKLPATAQFYSPWGSVSSTDPIDVLLHAGFSDHGAAFGHAWSAAVNGLHGPFASSTDLATASNLTERLANVVLADYRGGDLQQGLRPALAHTFADHYMADLHESARVFDHDPNYDPDGDGLKGSSSETGVSFSAPQLVGLMDKLCDDKDARTEFLAGMTKYQAQLIHDNAVAHPGPISADDPERLEWAKRIGSFDALLSDAHDQSHLAAAHDAVERRKTVIAALSAVTDLVKVSNPVTAVAYHATVDVAKDAITQHLTGGLEGKARDDNFSFDAEIRNSMDHAIISGYYDNHALGTQAQINDEVTKLFAQQHGVKPEHFFADDGRIVAYDKMTDGQRTTFNNWKDLEHVAKRTDGATAAAGDAFTARHKDL